MTSWSIILLGVAFVFAAVLLRQRQAAAFLAARGQEVVNIRDLINWWRLNLASMGGLVIILGIAVRFFAGVSPWLFWSAVIFIIAVFSSLLLMGYRLLLLKKAE